MTETMRLLHLVRHAPVIDDLDRASTEWVLAPNAGASVRDLLRKFDHSRLRRVLSSRQKKATETARILASSLDLPFEIREGLEEHHRLKEDYIAGDADFRQMLADFFDRPDELVFGQESADTALKRFSGAIHSLMNETDDDELIVSHGTVISLILASGKNGSPMELWSSLTSPDHIAVLWPSLQRVNA